MTSSGTPGRPGVARLALLAGSALAGMALAGCTGSPATLALQPAFAVVTSAGPASVSIRERLPNLGDAGSVQLIRTGMQEAMPGTVVPGPVAAPFPHRRIVWHVNPDSTRGVTRLMVNIFDGARPVADAQDLVANDAPPAALMRAIRGLTRRLMIRYAQLGAVATG